MTYKPTKPGVRLKINNYETVTLDRHSVYFKSGGKLLERNFFTGSGHIDYPIDKAVEVRFNKLVDEGQLKKIDWNPTWKI